MAVFYHSSTRVASNAMDEWMSPREYARLQGVPDFPLVGGTIQQLWGFADAVCVPAIQWIDQHVISPLYELATRTRSNAHA